MSTAVRRSGASAVSALPRLSRIGLNAANFFQAESVGVVLPVLNDFLRESHWRYDAIGLATAIAGLGTLLFQTPAGYLVDRVQRRRMLFAVASVSVGLCFCLIPLLPRTPAVVDPLLFASGVVASVFGPVLAALALAMAGHTLLNRTMGENQGWNHAGNIVAALVAFFLVGRFGASSIFYSVAGGASLGAASIFLMRRGDLDEARGAGDDITPGPGSWRRLLGNRTAFRLLLAVAAFHLANAPILPLTALNIKHLGGSDRLTTFTVLSAQAVMAPVAWMTGRLCDRWGRKPTMGVAFWVLPARIASYTLARDPRAVVALQMLDGIGAGIYGVAIVAFAADLTRKNGQFNTLMGVFATAQGIGGVLGPVLSGALLQRFGFAPTYLCFASLALAGALFYQAAIPETGGR